MKENTRFCTRSMRDNTKFGGLIHLQNFLHIRILLPYHMDRTSQKRLLQTESLMNSVIEILFKHKN